MLTAPPLECVDKAPAFGDGNRGNARVDEVCEAKLAVVPRSATDRSAATAQGGSVEPRGAPWDMTTYWHK